MVEGHHSSQTIARHFRAADFCYVGSLHDGMNLVSKEFVCARDDERGVLILSAFAGASHELGDALIINPNDLDAAAEAVMTALIMSLQEQRRRMRRMRETVANADAAAWATRVLADVTRERESRTGDGPAAAVATTVSGAIKTRPLAASDISAS